MKKKIFSYLNFIILFILMDYFKYIPMYLFNINFDSIIYDFIMDIIFIILVIFLYRKMFIRDSIDFKKNFKGYLLKSLKYYSIGLGIMYLSNIIIPYLFSNAEMVNDDAVRSFIDKYPLYMSFSVCIYAPICEELIFRKSIKDIVYSYGNNKIYKYLYVIVSGFIFALLHVISSSNIIDYIYIIPYLALGISFSLLYMKTDNIYNTIMLHFIHNMITLILYLI